MKPANGQNPMVKVAPKTIPTAGATPLKPVNKPEQPKVFVKKPETKPVDAKTNPSVVQVKPNVDSNKSDKPKVFQTTPQTKPELKPTGEKVFQTKPKDDKK